MSLSSLIRKRGAIKSKLTNFASHVNKYKAEFGTFTNDDAEQLQIMIDRADSNFEAFELIQTDIEVSCDENSLESEYEERNNFINTFIPLMAKAKTMLKAFNQSTVVSVDNSVNSSNGIANIKLPTIDLPKFDGQYSDWLEFKDTFQSLIHDNSMINNIQKYHYLRASLSGEASRAIQSLEFSSENYLTAWEILCARFDNSRLLIHNHLKALFTLQEITRESSKELRNLIDSVTKHLRSLASMKVPTLHWDAIIIYLIASKLDKTTAREWEAFRGIKDCPSLEELRGFLKSKADILESMEVNHQFKSNIKASSAKPIRHTMVATNQKCFVCQGAHQIYKCPDFLRLSINERFAKTKSLNLCNNCLVPGHLSKNCKGRGCKTCSLKHNTLIHFDREESSETPPQQSVSMHSSSISHDVLLSTALVEIYDKDGRVHVCRALLDSASQSNFISESLSKQLNLDVKTETILIRGINNVVNTLNNSCLIKLGSRNKSFQSHVNCFIIPKICNPMPVAQFDITKWKIPNHLTLADPNFNQPQQIDLLVGSELFWELLTTGRYSLGENMPVLHNTVFGYVVAGPVMDSIARSQRQCCLATSEAREINFDLAQFWEVEESTLSDQLSSFSDKQCEEYFQTTTFRDGAGRFVVRIPLKLDRSLLGSSRDIAIKRFLQLERRFRSDPEYKLEYSKFINEYIKLEHMTLVDSNNQSHMNFLPHHGVIKQDSSTTKLRVVFDGSAKTSSGLSFNEVQHIGPKIQNDLFPMLIRFRQFQFIVTADIAKMYRQILVHPDDRHMQCIVWRDDPNNDLKAYMLNTVTYGTASAPYLAIRCLKQLASEYKKVHPEAATIISDDFYVDDLITGFNSESDAIKFSRQVDAILRGACFHLRKWKSNNESILKSLRFENDSNHLMNLSNAEKILGILWDSTSDTIKYCVNVDEKQYPITKRLILSQIARIFDPLGLLSPVIVIAKILLQDLWKIQLHWDEPLPLSISRRWSVFCSKLHNLNNFCIPRNVCNGGAVFELHGFCDASQHAYGACIYLRSLDSDGNVRVNLLCSKSRVAPLKSLSIPRLELCGALLLATLTESVRASWAIPSRSCFMWCDSKVVLCWLKLDIHKLQIFVANRVSQINELTNEYTWQYVNTKENPADLASRGVYSNTLINCPLWWHGPPFLSSNAKIWVADEHIAITELNLPELKQSKESFPCVVENSTVNLLTTKFEKLPKIQRVLAYCLRFISNLKNPEYRECGPLTVDELNKSMNTLIRDSQQQTFSKECETLMVGKPLEKQSKLIKLAPFLDSNNLMRVGGRLEMSNLSYESKHPVLLDGKHKLAKLIAEAMHLKYLHAPPQLLLSCIRQSYWPTSGMNLVKSVVQKCIQCFKCAPKSLNPLMGQLPTDRVSNLPPFHCTGVDYAGPFLLKDRKGRGCKTSKAYICLFICFTTKAIHLELVTDLTTENFIAALRRFSSRRGTPSHMYSDNGTNFVGASRQLMELDNKKISETCTMDGIVWHFLPPNSPHMGGLWEAGVKSTKYHLKRVIKDIILTFEELYSLLTQIEAVLNSRPLYPLSSNPNDLEPLTPAHFLIGRPLTSLPDPDLQHIKVNRLSRYQLIQQMRQGFWKRWSNEYLHTLQQRHKWNNSSIPVAIDTLVLIKNENFPPQQWLLGRVTDVHPGQDNIVRVVSVKTAKGVSKRAVSRLCPLPMSTN